MGILQGIDIVLFVLIAFNVLYLFIFSLASCYRKKETVIETSMYRRIAILIPAYKEDLVIEEAVESCLDQNYPIEKYDIVVISDQMQDVTNQRLLSLGIILEIVHFENSTKAKSLNLAMSHLSGYDVALVLDADNTIEPDFLLKINQAFDSSNLLIYQTHRRAKNINTNFAYLDAVSEEINNNIFRQGHVNLGLSAALIGSGMAFNYELLKRELALIDAIGGFDRALELTLFKARIQVGYLPDASVLDEKIQNQDDFSRQRRRWLSAQWHYLCEYIGDLPAAFFAGNWDFCDKMFQQMSLPRVLLLGILFVLAFGISLFSWVLAVKWWLLLFLLLCILLMAIPSELLTWRLVRAMVELPGSFIHMFLNLFRLKGANKKFIHTVHGVKQSN